jgi:hypothetical protein
MLTPAPFSSCVPQVVLEVTKVWQLQNRATGRLFWHFSDHAAVWVHRLVTAPILARRAVACAQ